MSQENRNEQEIHYERRSSDIRIAVLETKLQVVQEQVEEMARQLQAHAEHEQQTLDAIHKAIEALRHDSAKNKGFIAGASMVLTGLVGCLVWIADRLLK